MKEYKKYFEANKESWNKRTLVHRNSLFYGLNEFKVGKTSLNKIELEELGDVKGKSLLHLQCHFGMDTLSWARLGAKCVGVDLSDEAIKTAKEINDEMGLDAEFILCNVYDLKEHLAKEFDIVFTSYGTIGWLPDLEKWAELVSFYLKPGGIFYIADFHPALWMMDDDFTYIRYSYFNKEVIVEEQQGTYSNRDAAITTLNYSWNHPFSEILNALIRHGMSIVHLNEFPFSPYNCFKRMEKGADGMWRFAGMDEKLPVMYSIKAKKALMLSAESF